MRTAVALLLLAAVLPSARGQTAGEVRILETELTVVEDGVIARGAFEARDCAHRWIEVWFQVRIGNEPLRQPDGKETLIQWGAVFTPENGGERDRWMDIRGFIPRTRIAGAVNLPKGATTVLTVLCDLWDPTAKAWLASGGEVAAPLLVTTSAEGAVVAFSTFNTAPAGTPPLRAHELKAGRAVTPAFRHLRPKANTTLVRTVGQKHMVHDTLYRYAHREHPDGGTVTDEFAAEVLSTARGGFFEPIDSPEAALELAALGHPGAVVVPTVEAFEAVLARMRENGWDAAVENPSPAAFGWSAAAIADLGWTVRGLLIETGPPGWGREGQVVGVEYRVTKGGRLGVTATRHIATGLDVLLATPGAAAWPRLPASGTLTEKVVEIPRFAEEVDEYLAPADWPEHLR